MNVPCLTPAMQAGWYSIYLPPGDGRLSWPNWLVSGPDGSQTRDLSITSPTTNHCTTKRVIIFSDSLHTTLLNCTLMLPVSTIPTITVHCMAVPCKCLRHTAQSYLTDDSRISYNHSLLSMFVFTLWPDDHSTLSTVMLRITQLFCLWSCSLKLPTSCHLRLMFIISLFLQPSQNLTI